MVQRHLEYVIGGSLHRVEPRLTVMACQMLMDTHHVDDAVALAESVLTGRTTNPAFGDLDGWLMWYRQSATSGNLARQPREIRYRRMARPADRVNPNRFALTAPAADDPSGT